MGMNDFRELENYSHVKRFVFGQTNLVSKDDPNKGHKIYIEPLGLKHIPTAMRAMGWNLSADLMDRWFETEKEDDKDWLEMPTNLKPNIPDPRKLKKSQVCTDKAKMDYLIKFKRIRDAINELLGKGKSGEKFSWYDTAAINSLRKLLLDKHEWNGCSSFDLDLYNKDVLTVEHFGKINRVSFGSPIDTLDDLYGSIGRADLHVAVDGLAFFESGIRKFKTRYIGFYIKDYYDFNKQQFLGVWTKDCVLSKFKFAEKMIETDHDITSQYGINIPEPVRFLAETYEAITESGVHYNYIEAIDWKKGEAIAEVWNSDFQNWRKKHNKGHDFITFSDVLWMPVEKILKLD